jgi:hypothetical protein
LRCSLSGASANARLLRRLLRSEDLPKFTRQRVALGGGEGNAPSRVTGPSPVSAVRVTALANPATVHTGARGPPTTSCSSTTRSTPTVDNLRQERGRDAPLDNRCAHERRRTRPS